MKPQPGAIASLRSSWHAYPRGNTLVAADGLGAGEEFAIAWCRPEPPPPYRRTFSGSRRRIPAAPVLPRHGTGPGLGLRPPSPAPLRRDKRSQGLACPRAPPAR